jgi:hypothetical protein
MVSPIELETMSSRLLEPFENDELNFEGFISSTNLIFFSELRKDKFADLGSLNLKVRGDSSSTK